MADEIEITALRLFAEHGMDAVTIDDIADAADISRRTFFRYFASKDDLFHGSPERQLDSLQRALNSAPGSATPATLVRIALLALAEEFDGRREALLLRTQIAAKNPNAMMPSRGQHNALLEAFVDAVATHAGIDPDTDLRPRVFVHAGFGAMLAAARNWLAAGAKGSLRDLTAEALDLIDLR